MSDTITISAEIRQGVGKGASRRLRHSGKIPAVLYGGDKDPVALTLVHQEILHNSVNETFYSSVLQIEVADDKKQQVVIRAMQRHPFKQQIMHLDFMRVSATEVLKILVPIHFIGELESPAGRTSGVVIQHQITDVEITALPRDLPEYLEVDLSELEAGEAVMLADIKTPQGVEIPQLAQAEDSEIMVANAIHISESQGTGAAAAAEALAEAELEVGIEPLIEEVDTEEEAVEGDAADDAVIEGDSKK